MTHCRGFTLVELMIVIIIFGFMVALGAPALSTWQTKHNVEAEIEKLHSNLQYARRKAHTEKVVWGVWWGTGNNPFNYCEIRRDNSMPPNGSISDTIDANPQAATSLKFPTNTSANVGSITFDARGFSNVLTTLYITTNTGASTDCISIFWTRIKVGKWDGANCNPK